LEKAAYSEPEPSRKQGKPKKDITEVMHSGDEDEEERK